jgi:guanylate kinase
MNRVLILAGPSAVGKTTVAKRMLSDYPGFGFIRSATTRAPRGDIHDSEYIYLTRPEFEECIQRGEMLEYTEYSGNFYGTPATEIKRIHQSGKTPLLILDLNGVKSLKSGEHFFSAFAVYLWDEPAVLESRLHERQRDAGYTEEAKRIFEARCLANLRDYKSLDNYADCFDLVLKNTDVKESAAEIFETFYSPYPRSVDGEIAKIKELI